MVEAIFDSANIKSRPGKTAGRRAVVTVLAPRNGHFPVFQRDFEHENATANGVSAAREPLEKTLRRVIREELWKRA